MLIAALALQQALPSVGRRMIPADELFAAMKVAEERRLDPAFGSRIAQLTVMPALLTEWQVLDFARTVRRTGPPHFKARRQWLTIGGYRSESWTDTDKCPALRDMLRAMRSLQFSIDPGEVDPRPPGVAPPPSPPLYEDGVIHTLRLQSSRQPDDSRVSVEVSGNHGAVTAWAERFIPKLDRCWVDAPPH